MSLRLGIDVGGTNTDAVILGPRDRLLAKAKRPTSEDVSTGIRQAVEAVLQESRIDPAAIGHAMLGTTHCTNAIVERKGLSRVGVIRLSAPSGQAVPPYLEWPEDMLRHLGGHYHIVKGGYEYNGRLLAEPDEAEIAQALRDLRQARVQALAVSCAFSPVNAEQEQLVGKMAGAILGEDFPVSLSSQIGSIGLLQRENATILNAAIRRIAGAAYASFQDALRGHGVLADLFITQNDGTLMSVDYARQYPVFTIASGPTNSLRGAAFLSGLSEAIVVDVGGTTTDVGILRRGFPRESTAEAQIGGVHTNFRMPDLISIGLGGGSLVRKRQGGYSVGPESVGYRITREALIFGGGTLTATDAAVACGMAHLGEPGRVSGLDRALVESAVLRIRTMVEEVIDKMKTSSEAVPVVLVGGGSILLPNRLAGASRVVRPENFDVANAIGAAIAQVSGSVDGVYDVATRGREAVVTEVREEARREAVRAGAAEESVEIVELEEIPLAYLPSNAVRFRVKAVGRLAGPEVRDGSS
jgi:N-methylhydantoinase A/oxoprolinase/acetone carboxylase beta subunit